MTWVLGYSVSLEHATEYEYVIDRGFFEREALADLPDDDREFMHVYLTTLQNINHRINIPGLCVEPGWVGRDMQAVFVLAVDEDATSPDDAEVYDELRAPIRYYQKLARITGHANREPEWYKVYDNTWYPDIGYVHPKTSKKLVPERGKDTGELEDGEDEKSDPDAASDGTENESDSSYEWDSGFG